LKSEGPLLVVDAGNLFHGRPAVAPSERPQQLEKAKLQAEAYALVGIDGMLPGVGDLAFGIATVRELATAHALPYVAANLECEGAAPFPPARVVERGGRSVGIVGVVGNSAKDPACRATEPIAAVRSAVAALDVDVVLVLSGQTIEEDEALAAAVPAVSLVVNGQARQQFDAPQPLPNGGLLLAAGSRGKQLGVVSFTLTPGASAWRDGKIRARLAEQKDGYARRRAELEGRIRDAADAATRDRLQKQADFMARKIEEVSGQLEKAAAEGGVAHEADNRLLDMGAEIADHGATAALLARAKERIAAAEPIASISALATGPFVGSSACTGCHAEEARQWGGTGHARAWTTLTATHNERDRACFSCHVTGAFHDDGPKEPGAVAGLEAVGCESCHGPGKAHAANPSAVDMVAEPDVSVCQSCHDGKQDGGRFDAATYFPKIAH
jgi:2',3'-cyclic-nucleotide 2'-phosphodiesterase (5'-nucleotidase family)